MEEDELSLPDDVVVADVLTFQIKTYAKLSTYSIAARLGLT